ncbi:MAG: hypothetical protein M3121_06895, partial [Chloroflexota bacterium]|nr:hypothetical protein [Chloroflexota bacterium]
PRSGRTGACGLSHFGPPAAPNRMASTVRASAMSAPAVGIETAFPLDDFTRYRLLEGLDDIGLTMRHEDAIASYEAGRAAWLPRVETA